MHTGTAHTVWEAHELAGRMKHTHAHWLSALQRTVINEDEACVMWKEKRNNNQKERKKKKDIESMCGEQDDTSKCNLRNEIWWLICVKRLETDKRMDLR